MSCTDNPNSVPTAGSGNEAEKFLADAEKRYSHMLEVLIGELKKADIQ